MSTEHVETAQRSVIGTVSSDKMEKTIVVVVERKVRHPLYGKYIRRSTRLHAHDETNEAKIGDVVSVIQTRPYSKKKCWKLLSVLERSV